MGFVRYGAVYYSEVGVYILCCNDVGVCADVRCVSSVVNMACFLNLEVCLCIEYLCNRRGGWYAF